MSQKVFLCIVAAVLLQNSGEYFLLVKQSKLRRRRPLNSPRALFVHILKPVFSLRSMHVRKLNFSYKFYCAVHETWANFKYFQYIYIHAKILEYNRMGATEKMGQTWDTWNYFTLRLKRSRFLEVPIQSDIWLKLTLLQLRPKDFRLTA